MKRTATLLLLIASGVGCTPDTPLDPRPNFAIEGIDEGSSHLLLTADHGTGGGKGGGGTSGTTLVRGEPWTTSWNPSAWVFCLLTPSSFSQDIDYSGATPLPEAVHEPAVVGCNTALPSGRQVFEFNAENTPGWNALVAALTNGTDDWLWSLAFLVSPEMVPFGMGGGAAPESCDICWHRTGYALSGPTDAPDLSGFHIERIKLLVFRSEWTTSPAPPDPLSPGQYYLNSSFEYTWEIYGDKIPRPN